MLKPFVHLLTASCLLGFSPPNNARPVFLQEGPESISASSVTENTTEEPPHEQQEAVTEPVTEITETEQAAQKNANEQFISRDDPAALQAQNELEGATSFTLGNVPKRMLPLQRAGWWTLLSGFVLATTGGVLAGFAEVKEDHAERLATTFDSDAGSELLYQDQKRDYESILRRGEIYQWTSRGFLIAGAATLIAGITILAIHRKRHKQKHALGSKHFSPTGVGLEIRF